MNAILSDLERQALRFPLFQGDETPRKVMRDHFVSTRSVHQCVICRSYIPVAERVRALTELNRESYQVMTFYSCVECCGAMISAVNGNDEPICRRTALGMGKPFNGDA